MITMVLGGLWHGAASRFILWGAWHGMGLAVHKAFMSRFPGFKAQGMDMPRWRRIIGMVITFNFVCASWIMFRASDTQTGLQMLSQIFTDFRPELIPQVITGYLPIFGLIALGYFLHLLPEKAEAWGERVVIHTPLIAKALVIAILVWGVMLIKSSDVQPFIYFQF